MPVILITGASSGIGAALARRYAAPGTRLVLVARGLARLEAVAAACRASGAEVRIESLDVRDRAAAGALVRALDAESPIDLVVTAAGINGGDAGGGLESETVAFDTVDIDLLGTLNVMLPCVSLMSARGRGQVALIASLAAYAPLPDAPAYSGAKAALLAHGTALRDKLRPLGVRLSVVTPGYVASWMGGAYEGWRPLEISAEDAAARIARGLARDQGVIAFPFLLTHLARVALLVPEGWRRFGMAAFRFRIREQP